jgi:hypothetical protein
MRALQLKKGEHYSSKKLQEDHKGSSWENRETRLSLNKNLANWVFQSLELSLSLCIWLVNSLE